MMAEELYFKVIGRGKPLICLHGYALDHTIWLETAEEIKSEVRLILPDLLGHGKSPAPEGIYTMSRMAKDVINMMDGLQIEQAYIAGHSMGGYVALALAKYYPIRLSGLALVASHAFADTEKKKKERYKDIETLKILSPYEILSGMPEKLTKNSQSTEFCKLLTAKMSKNGMAGVLAGMAERLNMIKSVASIRKPVMMIAGTDDQIIPMKTFIKMKTEINHAQLVEVSNAGHVPMLDNPQDTAQALLKFIN